MVQRHKVNKLWRIFSVDCTNIFNNHIGHILHFFTIVPELIEQLHILMRKGRFYAVDHVVSVVAAFTSDVHRSESGDRHVGDLRTPGINGHKAHHVLAGGVGLEFRFSANPVSTLLRNSALGHFIAELDFKFCAVQASFSRQTGDIELTFLLFYFFFYKGRRCKNKPERFYGLQLFL